MITKNWPAALAALALIASIALANWLTIHYGLIPAGFGLLVTAGTYAAGLALGLRDVLHEAGGIRWVLGAIAAGIAVSLLLGDGRIALASAAAFGLAELADLAVYAPLRRRQWHTAVIASNAAGAVVDTLVFLTIAGFPLTATTIGGQLLVKAVWVTAGFLLVAEVIRRAVPRERLIRTGA
jgi:uncharacterized PurR-regulated membrane protein YhhQ (DUF165 family)